jgi:hypothetical protein
VLTFVGGFVLSLSILYDFYSNWPFSSVEMSKFYGVAASFFFILCCMNFFWRFVDSYADDRIFFDIFILSVGFSGFVISLYN